MTLYEFNLLPQSQKLSFLLEECTFLAAHTPDDTYKSCLYHAKGKRDPFFIEVYYNVAAQDIEYWRTFQNTCLLEPYLENLNVSQWLSKGQQ